MHPRWTVICEIPYPSDVGNILKKKMLWEVISYGGLKREVGGSIIKTTTPKTEWPTKGPLIWVPMSHVDFKEWQCRMSLLLIFQHATSRI